MFQLDAVTVQAGGRPVLHKLDLRIGGPGVCGLIGHNGSGKSTLLRVLARQLAPSSGAVQFAGRDLRHWPRRKLARHLAYLPQATPDTGGLTVRELVALGRFAWHGPLGRFGAGDRAAVEAAMGRTGVARFAGDLADQLSGGERQCAWIAMCVAQQTRCLLLDEPVSALDVANQMRVMRVVQELSREGGIGVVVVLHDLNLAAQYCDELVALREGRVIARGTPGQVMQPDTLEAIYRVRLGLLPHPAGRAPIAYLA